MNDKADLQSSVECLRGIGSKFAAALQQAGIGNIQQLIGFFPVSYKDYTALLDLSELVADEPHLYTAVIAASPKVSYGKRNSILTVELCNPARSVRATAKIFNQPYLAASLDPEQTVFIDGTARICNGRVVFSAPKLLKKLPDNLLTPVYRKVAGVPPARLQLAIRDALHVASIEDPFSSYFCHRFGVKSRCEAYRQIHVPRNIADAEQGRRRFALENGLVLTRMLDLIGAAQRVESTKIIAAESFLQEFIDKLEFVPTEAQLAAMREIACDLEGTVYMNRLLEGDVGSGKTVVALFAMYAAAQEGYQTILLAPTEILATQHAEKARRLFGDCSVALLTGHVRKDERRELQKRIGNGSVSYIVGTHALLYDQIDLSRVALLVTDEQHRFGVRQRRQLLGHQMEMHSLVMSATPIPRSLSLAAQGYVRASVLDELPGGRKPIKTRIVNKKKRAAMFDFVAEKVRHGEQAYIVCAAISESNSSLVYSAEAVYTSLTRRYPDIRIGLLHGSMPTAAKTTIMNDFRSGVVRLLVSTTVIEVGVDVPQATQIVILDADHFGLAQLHQLRGRVGRGTGESWCFLVPSSPENSRLEVLTKTNDGFKIAEADLKERGIGEILGLQQHGHSESVINEAWMLDAYRNMLNEMAQKQDLQADFLHVDALAQQRLRARIANVALN